MARTTRTAKTAEDYREEMEALHQCLGAEVAKLRSSAGWSAYLGAAMGLRRFSINNALLIMAQAPGATDVATYEGWRARGRQVCKGEKSIKIRAPRVSRVGEKDQVQGSTEAPTPDTGGARSGARVTFRALPVFDVSQTKPADGTEDALPAPAQIATRLGEVDPGDLYEMVAAHLERTGVALRTTLTPPGLDGFARKVPPAGAPKAPESDWVVEVVLDERLGRADAANTITHEACHIAAGHLEQIAGDRLDHRGRIEVEAESACFMVAALAGLDTTTVATGYIASWMAGADDATLTATAAAAVAAATTLAAALGLIEHDEHDEREQHAAA